MGFSMRYIGCLLFLFFTSTSYAGESVQDVRECFKNKYLEFKKDRENILYSIYSAAIPDDDQFDQLRNLVKEYFSIQESITHKEYFYWLENSKNEYHVGMSQPFWVIAIPTPYLTEEEVAIIASIDKEYSDLLDKELQIHQDIEEQKNSFNYAPKNIDIDTVRSILGDKREEFFRKGRELNSKCSRSKS